ncbi:MAG TPA: M43 family zinc metalloprotease, partial [Bacteroidia bacterium]|nr:M43 family zinc metalloprotease [Bacteroidia bacterium]
IPVIFHVIWNTTAQNISTTRITDQMNVLNKDFRKLNTDTNLVPSVWKSIAADCEINFCLAQRDPNGNWTDGIERVQTTVTNFGSSSDIKFTANGGANAWDRNKYLNIWVGNLGSSLLGYATPPGGSASFDGVVLQYTAVGVAGASPPYNKGRTATHEIGHWLNLRHIWGDDGSSCSGTDNVTDTPNQADENYGCPSFPLTDACQTASPGVMWMNYMDYTNDACMYMFTAGQKTRMGTCLNGTRVSIKTSNGCTPVGITENSLAGIFAVYPSPTNGAVTLDFGTALTDDFDVIISNAMGQVVYTRHYDAIAEEQLSLDLSGNSSGIYFIEVQSRHEKVIRKVILH